MTILNLLEKLIVLNLAIGIKSRSQMVEQLSHGNIECRIAMIYTVVGYRTGHMGFAAADRPDQNNPSLRVFGKLMYLIQCKLEKLLRDR